MTSDQPVSRSRMWCRFIFGMAWLAIIAGRLTQLTGYPFAAMYAVTVCGALFISGLALTWLFRWAVNERSRERQFAVSSLFFLTTFVALYFAAIRWIAGQIETDVGQQLPWQAMLAVALAVAVFAIVTCPFVLWVTEALLWFAVWLVRWPPARSVWRRFVRHHRRAAR
jgi:hypothetical protein